jgi:hypothetical protein
VLSFFLLYGGVMKYPWFVFLIVPLFAYGKERPERSGKNILVLDGKRFELVQQDSEEVEERAAIVDVAPAKVKKQQGIKPAQQRRAQGALPNKGAQGQKKERTKRAAQAPVVKKGVQEQREGQAKKPARVPVQRQQRPRVVHRDTVEHSQSKEEKAIVEDTETASSKGSSSYKRADGEQMEVEKQVDKRARKTRPLQDKVQASIVPRNESVERVQASVVPRSESVENSERVQAAQSGQEKASRKSRRHPSS